MDIFDISWSSGPELSRTLAMAESDVGPVTEPSKSAGLLPAALELESMHGAITCLQAEVSRMHAAAEMDRKQHAKALAETWDRMEELLKAINGQLIAPLRALEKRVAEGLEEVKSQCTAEASSIRTDLSAELFAMKSIVQVNDANARKASVELAQLGTDMLEVQGKITKFEQKFEERVKVLEAACLERFIRTGQPHTSDVERLDTHSPIDLDSTQPSPWVAAPDVSLKIEQKAATPPLLAAQEQKTMGSAQQLDQDALTWGQDLQDSIQDLVNKVNATCAPEDRAAALSPNAVCSPEGAQPLGLTRGQEATNVASLRAALGGAGPSTAPSNVRQLGGSAAVGPSLGAAAATRSVRDEILSQAMDAVKKLRQQNATLNEENELVEKLLEGRSNIPAGRVGSEAQPIKYAAQPQPQAPEVMPDASMRMRSPVGRNDAQGAAQRLRVVSVPTSNSRGLPANAQDSSPPAPAPGQRQGPAAQVRNASLNAAMNTPAPRGGPPPLSSVVASNMAGRVAARVRSPVR